MNYQNHTAEEICTASKEGKILTSQLISEIIPLLTDYLIADFSQNDNSIKVQFFNGQNFEIRISEV